MIPLEFEGEKTMNDTLATQQWVLDEISRANTDMIFWIVVGLIIYWLLS